jgi:hypothetical protein
LDDLPVDQKGVKYRFSGKRVTRRLDKASNGLKYNADYVKLSQTLLAMG